MPSGASEGGLELKKSILNFSRLAALAVVISIAGAALAQQDYGSRLGTRKMDVFRYEAQGPGVLLGALDPALRKWYVPQELYEEYQWRQWEYTNYARERFQRYVNSTLEGDYFYDIYGTFTTRGWLIFDHTQKQPQQQLGNTLFKDERFATWFNSLLIAFDNKGQYYYALSIGQRLRTILTPLTFSKSQFDGVQWDFASDKYSATILYSRVSDPGGSTADPAHASTNNTSLFGSRATAQIGDFVTVGGTLVNAHQSHTQLSSFEGNVFTGELTVDQNTTLSWVEIILRDDSPEDGVAGASYFQDGSDLIITYLDGFVESAKDIDFEPIVEGGFERVGFLAADGNESIRIRYDFDSPGFVAGAHGDKTEIENVRFNLALGNDYQVWVNSNRQTSRASAGTGSSVEQSVPLLIARAPKNAKDNSNLHILSFDYGLPTAIQVLGATVEMNEILGFNLYGEYDISSLYRMYSNPNLSTHDFSSGVVGAPFAAAWMVNLSKHAYPWFVFGEGFSMDHDYSTTAFVSQNTPRPGFVDYRDTRRFFEFVDDNDDQDRFPDNERIDWLTGDFEVFPGWDENSDFISDFNQNDNRRGRRNDFPDYEEPFLRYNVDRPEYLFGTDTNNNGWVDRFENDEEPDYPYKRDHRGYNVYGGTYLTPYIRLMAGRIDERLLSEDRDNETNYLLVTLDRDYPGVGRLRIFDMAKRARDNIPENLFQWVYLTSESAGELRRLTDPLLFEDASSNNLWLGFDYTGVRNLNVVNKVKYDLTRIHIDREDREFRGLSKNEHFFGLINKASYALAVRRFQLNPRWKSEYRHQSHDLVSATKREELTQLFSVLVHLPLLSGTLLQGGAEFLWFKDLREDQNDLTSRVVGLQCTNRVAYQGYELTSQWGIKFDRRKRARDEKARTTSETFLTVFAGLGK